MNIPQIVSSFDDPFVDAYRNVTDADLRGRKHLFMVESEIVVRRLLKTNWNIHSVFLFLRINLNGSRHSLNRAKPLYMLLRST